MHDNRYASLGELAQLVIELGIVQSVAGRDHDRVEVRRVKQCFPMLEWLGLPRGDGQGCWLVEIASEQLVLWVLRYLLQQLDQVGMKTEEAELHDRDAPKKSALEATNVETAVNVDSLARGKGKLIVGQCEDHAGDVLGLAPSTDWRKAVFD